MGDRHERHGAIIRCKWYLDVRAKPAAVTSHERRVDLCQWHEAPFALLGERWMLQHSDPKRKHHSESAADRRDIASTLLLDRGTEMTKMNSDCFSDSCLLHLWVVLDSKESRRFEIGQRRSLKSRSEAPT
jgi:hypothetical protein